MSSPLTEGSSLLRAATVTIALARDGERPAFSVSQCTGERTPLIAQDSLARASDTIVTSRAYDAFRTPHSDASSCSASTCTVVIMHQ